MEKINVTIKFMQKNKFNNEFKNYFKFISLDGISLNYEGEHFKFLETELLKETTTIIYLKNEILYDDTIRNLEKIPGCKTLKEINDELNEKIKYHFINDISVTRGSYKEIKLSCVLENHFSDNRLFCFDLKNYKELNELKTFLEKGKLDIVLYTTLEQEEPVSVKIEKCQNINPINNILIEKMTIIQKIIKFLKKIFAFN